MWYYLYENADIDYLYYDNSNYFPENSLKFSKGYNGMYMETPSQL